MPEEGDDIIKSAISMPPKIYEENKFNVTEKVWENFNESGRYLFNFVYEFLDRNQDNVFATDLFKLEGFTNQQIITVQKILNAAKFNMCVVAADFISAGQDYYDEEGNYNPDPDR